MKTSAALFLTDILPQKRKFFSKIVKNKVFGKSDPDEVFAMLRKSGVDGIELFLPSYTKIIFDDIREAKKLLDINQMPVFSVHQSLRFFSKTKIAEITTLFAMADVLGAKVIVLHMSSAGKQLFDKEYTDTLHSLEEKYGMKVGFENREKYIGSILDGYGWDQEKFSTLMKEAGFSITLDTTHLAQAGGDIVSFFKQNKDRIVNIHLSDYKPHFLNSSLRPFRFKHLPLGKGKLPIDEFIKTLKKENYKGLITMEMHTDLEGMCESAEVIKKIAKKAN